jgi:hypothetical protein
VIALQARRITCQLEMVGAIFASLEIIIRQPRRQLGSLPYNATQDQPLLAADTALSEHQAVVNYLETPKYLALFPSNPMSQMFVI